MGKYKKLCGDHWRHSWERVGSRQRCLRCGIKNRLHIIPEVRFFDHVRFDESGCWLWTGATCFGGYGLYGDGNRRYRVHRYSWWVMGNPYPPKDMDLHHVCNVRLCVNPAHLRVVTRQENIDARPQSGFCKKGHKFEPGMYRSSKNGSGGISRRCLICLKARLVS